MEPFDTTRRISPLGSMETAEREIACMCAMVSRSLLPVALAIGPLRTPHPGSPPKSKLQAIFSPSAPQVEYNVLDKMAFETERAQDLHAPKGRAQDQDLIMRRETRNTTRSKNLAELTDRDEDNINPPTLCSSSTDDTALFCHRMLSLGRFNAVCL
jgi:hypothetical protein